MSFEFLTSKIQKNNFLLIGRAGVDIYPDPPGTKTENAKSFVTHLGGSSANMGVQLTLFGGNCNLLTRVSDDALGKLAINQLNHYGVKNKLVENLKNKQDITISNIQSYPISLSLRRQYHQKNILILGEGLHTIHPVAGQGFNLVLRDIKKLKEIIKYYVGLGISIKNSYALNDFYNSRKPENTIISLGVDATHSFFKQNKYLDPFKEIIVKNIKNNETLKKFSKIISNRGLSL